jgi:hypothetical protein
VRNVLDRTATLSPGSRVVPPVSDASGHRVAGQIGVTATGRDDWRDLAAAGTRRQAPAPSWLFSWLTDALIAVMIALLAGVRFVPLT